MKKVYLLTFRFCIKIILNGTKVNDYYENKIDDLRKKNSTEGNLNISKEKKIVNLNDSKKNIIEQTKKSKDNHKVNYYTVRPELDATDS